MIVNTKVSIPKNDALDLVVYKKGKLFLEDVSIETLAQKVGTPFYAYAQLGIEKTYERCAQAFKSLNVGVFYAMKANHNQSVLRILGACGSGVDIVSIGEAYRAVAAGIPANKIIFSGAGKTEHELSQALDLGLYQINVESANELEVLNTIALSKNKKAPIAIRINPDVDAKTIKHTATGKKGNKFGVDIEDALLVYERAAKLPGLHIVGVAVHIGSQLVSVEPFRAAYIKTVDFIKTLRSRDISISRLDLGGGLGVWYQNENIEDFEEWAVLIDEVTRGLDVDVSIAPGRSLIAHSGLLVSRVVHVKQGSDRQFLVLDAAMNDLARPSLYGSYHHIIPTNEPPLDTKTMTYDIVGPVCESTDIFAHARQMPAMQDGDLVAFLSAGAYCASMSSAYNSRPLIPEILVNKTFFDIVRPRPTYEDMIAAEPEAFWLKDRTLKNSVKGAR